MTTSNILLINPNTSTDVTESIRRLAIEEVGSRAEIRAVTARFGARYISTAASFTIAAHAVLDAYALAVREQDRIPDAVVIGCFGDPGIDGLRELAGVPVTGFAESGMMAAMEGTGDFIVATVGQAWREILTGMARQHGFADRLKGVITLDDHIRDPLGAAGYIDSQARGLGAARVVIGGAGLIGVISQIAAHMKLEVIDPHRAALRDAVSQSTTKRADRDLARTAAGEYQGLSSALQQMLSGDSIRPQRPAGAI